MSPGPRFPIVRIGADPLFLANFLGGIVDRIGLHLMPLPLSLLGPLTLWLLASDLVFMPWARVKQVARINTENLTKLQN
jgi:hypothetical protein